MSVAGYFRVSHARDDMRAPELYRDQIERYCAYKGLVLAETFSDIDYSAFRGAKSRPAPEELTIPSSMRPGETGERLAGNWSGGDRPRGRGMRGARLRCAPG